MDVSNDPGEELFSHNGVLVKSHTLFNKNLEYLQNLGSLSVVEYADGKTFIEWRYTEIAVESDTQEQDWAMVHEIGRHRTTSESCSMRQPVIQIPLNKIKSFHLTKSSRQLSLSQKDGITHSIFFFQHGNAELFVSYLRSIIKTTNCSRDRHLYLIMDDEEFQNLNQSFAELELFDDDQTYAVFKFMKNLHHKPYETAMQAFAKVTDAILAKPLQDGAEVDGKLLHQSLTELPEFPKRVSNEEYEVIAGKEPLPPRTTPSRTPPLNSEQWNNFFDEQGRILEYSIVKEIVFHGGVEPYLRKEVWKYLLDYLPWTATHTERQHIRKQKKDEYFSMKLQWMSMTPGQEDRFQDYKDRKSLIEKDVNRTDRTIPFYADDHNPNLSTLQDILMTYVMYNFDLGYVQGMNDLLSPILYIMEDEVDSFWCFVGFMNHLSHNFDLDQAGMKLQLQQLYTLLTTVEPELASYLDHHESSNMFFCFRWLLVWFKREFSYADTMLLWEVIWAQDFTKNFHLLVCIAILDTEKETLMSNDYGFTEILKHINELSENMNITEILKKAEAIYNQLSSAKHLPLSVRHIVGLKEEISNTNEDLCQLDIETNSSTLLHDHNLTNNSSSSNPHSDTDEKSFENSMMLNF